MLYYLDMKRFTNTLLAAFLCASPVAAAAQRYVTVYGNTIDLQQFMGNIVSLGTRWIVGLTTTLFLIGAFMMVLFAGQQTKVDLGKKIMTGALTGLAVVMLSYAIIESVFYVIYS